jgi:hypothetical protein
MSSWLPMLALGVALDPVVDVRADCGSRRGAQVIFAWRAWFLDPEGLIRVLHFGHGEFRNARERGCTWEAVMRRMRQYQRFAARCLEEARTTIDPRLKAFMGEMAQEWQRLVEEANGAKNLPKIQSPEVDPGD